MAPKCYVPGCNYGFARYTGPKRTTFAFPTDPVKKRLWIEAIRRVDFAPTIYSVVCENHFEDDCFLRKGGETVNTEVLQPDGSVLVKESKSKSKLNPDAVPSIFLEEPLPENRGRASSNRFFKIVKRRLAQNEELPEAILEASSSPRYGKIRRPSQELTIPVTSFASLSILIEAPPSTLPSFSTKWLITLNKGTGDAGAVFYQFDPENEMPVILKSVTVDKSLLAKAYFDNHRISPDAFDHPVATTSTVSINDGSTMSINTWNQLLDILETTDCYTGPTYRFDYQPPETSRAETYGRALLALNDRKQELQVSKQSLLPNDTDQAQWKDVRELFKLNFLMEQISLLDSEPNRRAFSQPLYAWTETIMQKSLDVCRFLERSAALTLPIVKLEEVMVRERLRKKKRTLSKNVSVEGARMGDLELEAVPVSLVETTEDDEAAINIDRLLDDENRDDSGI